MTLCCCDRCSVCSGVEAGARWTCKWCLHDNVCRDSFSSCRDGNFVENSAACPRIVHTQEILLPNNVEVQIRYCRRPMVIFLYVVTSILDVKCMYTV